MMMIEDPTFKTIMIAKIKSLTFSELPKFIATFADLKAMTNWFLFII